VSVRNSICLFPQTGEIKDMSGVGFGPNFATPISSSLDEAVDFLYDTDDDGILIQSDDSTSDRDLMSVGMDDRVDDDDMALSDGLLDDVSVIGAAEKKGFGPGKTQPIYI